MNYIPASGRFSDGKLVIDYLSEYFELPAAPAAFQPGINSSAAQSGLNFASSGAGVLDTSTPDKGFPLSMQLSRFSELGGLQAAEQQSDFPPLAIVSMGTNDYIAFLAKGIDMGRQMDPSELLRLAEILPQLQRLVTAVVRGITDAVRTLYASGFRHFLLFDTLPIGCTPLSLATIAEAQGQLLDEPAPSYCSPAHYHHFDSMSTALNLRLPRARVPSRALILLIAAVHFLAWECRAAARSPVDDAPWPAQHGLRGRGLAGASASAPGAAKRGERNCALARPGRKFGAIYTFGDSLADVGNNNYGGPLFYRANFPPYGMNFIPASGRFSDGKLIIDYLSEYFELPAAPAAFQPGINSSAAQSGLNFASSGAGVLDATNVGQVFPLSAQLARFSELGGLQAPAKPSRPALAIISVATDDYLVFLARGDSTQSQSLIAAVIAGIANTVQTLYAAGFRHFLLFDTLPIGCTPIAHATLAESLGQPSNVPAPSTCNPAVNQLTAGHSATLALALSGLRDELEGATVVYARTHALMQAIVETPRDYGLNVGTSACCGAPPPINGLVQCGTSIFISNGTQSSTPATLCADSQSRAFWDFVHPSEAANQVVARALVCALQAGVCDADLVTFANRDDCYRRKP
ncbi:unnamed protein product [Closterium sp. Naga37s-1]|nr:unnamed protein product [Closterium sp. Naga37s-1]